MPNISMLAMTFLVILVISVIGYINRPGLGVPDGEIGLEIGVPVQHVLQAGYDTLPLPVVLRLRNRTQAEASLNVDDPCKVFRFVVTTASGEFVQAPGSTQDCTLDVKSSFLLPQENLEEIRQVPLDASRYQNGEYRLHVKFWNYSGEATFTLTDSQ
ncbi:hypothetical protein N9X91_00290 [Alphaproteobacteria bacterium]|nr:hypothetical protein [Alphaproteobacteria bacterium]